MIKEVEVNGMKRNLFGEKEIEAFEKTIEKVKRAEKYLVNFYVDFDGDNITYCFGIDTRKADDNFELKFILRDDLQTVELSTTYSNQCITDEFIELLNELNQIKKEGI